MSLISTAWGVPSVVGPFIAGGLTEFVSWRWAFLSIAPLVPPPLFLVPPRVGAPARAARRAAAPPPPPPRRPCSPACLGPAPRSAPRSGGADGSDLPQ